MSDAWTENPAGEVICSPAFLATVREAWRLLEAASHTLRSYQYGNAATDPAKDMADAIDRFRATGEPETLAGKAGG